MGNGADSWGSKVRPGRTTEVLWPSHLDLPVPKWKAEPMVYVPVSLISTDLASADTLATARASSMLGFEKKHLKTLSLLGWVSDAPCEWDVTCHLQRCFASSELTWARSLSSREVRQKYLESYTWINLPCYIQWVDFWLKFKWIRLENIRPEQEVWKAPGPGEVPPGLQLVEGRGDQGSGWNGHILFTSEKHRLCLTPDALSYKKSRVVLIQVSISYLLKVPLFVVWRISLLVQRAYNSS